MIKVLARSIREYKKASILTPLLVTVEVIMECIIPFIIANLVSQMQAGCSMSVIAQYGAVLIAMSVISLIFGGAAGATCATASAGFARNLRKDMFYKIQGYSFENIDKFLVSSLVTRLTTDITNVQMAYMMIIRIAIRCPLMLIFSFAMGFIMGGRLAVIFLFTIPLLGIGLFFVIRSATPLFRKVFRKYDALNDSVQENIQAMRVVKSYVREDYEKKKFGAAAENVQKDFTKAERIMAINSPMMQICVYAGMAFVMSYGSYTVITSRGLDLNVGQMSSMLTYSFQILMSLMMLSMVFGMITMSAESAERIVEVLSEESTLKSPEGGLTEVKDGSVDFDNVSFKYSKKADRMALSDIDLHIYGVCKAQTQIWHALRPVHQSFLTGNGNRRIAHPHHDRTAVGAGLLHNGRVIQPFLIRIHLLPHLQRQSFRHSLRRAQRTHHAIQIAAQLRTVS